MKRILFYIVGISNCDAKIPLDGKYIYADLQTNTQGIHTMSMQLGSNHKYMSVLMKTYEYKSNIVMGDYQYYESETACYVDKRTRQVKENEDDKSKILNHYSLKDDEIEDTMTVTFRDQLHYGFRSIFSGSIGVGTKNEIGLKPYAASIPSRYRNFVW